VPAKRVTTSTLGPKAWKELAPRLQNAGGIFLFLDYDGTLTPIVKTPVRAKPSKRCISLLARLADLPRVRVAVVSGRTVKDLDNLLRASEESLHEKIFRIGIHGIEFARPGDSNARAFIPRKSWEKRLAELRSEMDIALAGEPGIILEDKGLSLALHYRMASPGVAKAVLEFFRNRFKHWRFREEYELLQGKKVIEIRPRGHNKGTAVKRLLEKCGDLDDLAVYAGDDHTDEDAFRILKKPAVTIKVGGSSKPTAARYWLRSPRELLDRLEDIARLRGSH
jgi:trehalose 6-phosphate phosphatase